MALMFPVTLILPAVILPIKSLKPRTFNLPPIPTPPSPGTTNAPWVYWANGLVVPESATMFPKLLNTPAEVKV